MFTQAAAAKAQEDAEKLAESTKKALDEAAERAGSYILVYSIVVLSAVV